MNIFLLITQLFVFVLFTISVIKRGFEISFPFVFSLVYVLFVNIPLIKYSILVSEQIGFDEVFFGLFSLLCVTCAIGGYYTLSNYNSGGTFNFNLNWVRLKWLILLSAIIGVIASAAYINVSIELGSKNEGRALLYNFFTPAARGALFLALWQLKSKGKSRILQLSVLLVLVGYYLPNIILLFKRNIIIDLVLIYLFYTRIAVLSLLRAILLSFPLLLVSQLSIDSLRSELYSYFVFGSAFNLSEVFDNSEVFVYELPVELNTAVNAIGATKMTGVYDFGFYHWNRFVFNYVPGQLVGDEIKASLMLDIGSIDADLAKVNFTRSYYTTLTGFADSFKSFGYLGVLKFWLVGLLMGWLRKPRSYNTFPVLYVWMFVSSLHIITHDTHWVPNSLFQGLVFLGIPIVASLKLK